MTKTKKLILVLAMLLTVISVISFLRFSTNICIAKAEEQNEVIDVDEKNVDSNEIMPRGLITNLTLAIDGGDGNAWATAKNTFTLFPAIVRVKVELYSSDTYQDSYKNMTLTASNYTSDLNMGESLVAKASTNGRQRYWQARMYYKIDNNDWEERVTSTWLLDAQGIVVL